MGTPRLGLFGRGNPAPTKLFNMSTLYSRRSIRLQHYDYSQNGGYFVTVCTHQRQSLFGEIMGGKMVLNMMGIMVRKHWLMLENKFNTIQLDEFIIMPNHFHGILIIKNGMDRAIMQMHTATLGKILAFFKYQTTKEMNQIQNQGIKKLWQRNYYEHIIRNEKSLHNIRAYIIANPSNWKKDNLFIN